MIFCTWLLLLLHAATWFGMAVFPEPRTPSVPHWAARAQTPGTLSDQEGSWVVYDWERLAAWNDPRLVWLGLAVVGVALAAYVVWSYRRERAPGPLRLLLPGLRLLAWAALILFFLHPTKRVDQQQVTDSQVLLVVDTSQSMSVADAESTTTTTRAAAVSQLLQESSLIDDLRTQHDVVLATVDQQFQTIWRWPRRHAPAAEEAASEGGDWQVQLEPLGTATRLGDAMEQALATEGPLAGLFLFSDGGQNQGVDPLAVAETAAQRQVPVCTVGLGSTSPRRNVQVQDLNAPTRVFPHDKTKIQGLVQAEGLADRRVQVELFVRDAAVAGAATSAGELVGRQTLSPTAASQVLPVEFEFEPAAVGRLLLELRASVEMPRDREAGQQETVVGRSVRGHGFSGDQNPADNSRVVEMEVVEAQTRVLLFADGATRDYRFLRNQLRRDPHASVDVYLQSAQPGISQDADRILDGFPRSAEALEPYDCVVAFDPDWKQLDAVQVDALESWVAAEAGGLIVVAGPVHTAGWIQSAEHSKIRGLYPVEFQKRVTLLDDGVYGSKVPWPIQFSRDGQQSKYLWLAATESESRAVWSEFPGVFGCYAVKGAKRGARVLGRYSDPDAGLSAERPVYWAEHFYGSGRVFYMGSGEVWRLRKLDVGYFEMLYTNLIRHVSQGRMLRDSTRGQLLLQRDRYTSGEEVVVRAQLQTASRQPLVAERVTAHVVGPREVSHNLALLPDPLRAGSFVGQFPAGHTGSYRIELAVPGSMDEYLIKRLQVVMPDLEFDQTRRNDSLLAAVAERSGGQYYPSLSAVLSGNDHLPPAGQLLPSRAERKTLRGTPDRGFTLLVRRLLLGVCCGALCLEWLLRRFVRLA